MFLIIFEKIKWQMESINQNLDTTFQKLKQIEEKMNYEKSLMKTLDKTSENN